MKNRVLFWVIVFFLPFFGCDISVLDNDPDLEYGRLYIHLTDAPFPFDIVEEANITISRVELFNESDTTDDNFITIFEDTAIFNLLDLRNGVTECLLETEVPVGNYNTLRVYVIEAGILLVDQKTYDLKVPSGEQTGIKVKIEPGIKVLTGLSSEILLDFDVSKSFVLNGNTNKPDGIKGFIFKPVVRAVNYTSAGSIAGTVIDPSASVLPNMEVWIETDTVLTTSYTNAEGVYGIIGIPAGTYSIYATGEGYDTASYTNVEVVEGNMMIKNFTLDSL